MKRYYALQSHNDGLMIHALEGTSFDAADEEADKLNGYTLYICNELDVARLAEQCAAELED